MGSICKRLQMLPIFDRMMESDFLFLSAVILLLFLIFACGIHIGFDFPKLLRICPDGFELGIGFFMLLFQSGILCFQLVMVKLAVRELGGQFAAGLVELFQLAAWSALYFSLERVNLIFCKPSYTGFISR